MNKPNSSASISNCLFHIKYSLWYSLSLVNNPLPLFLFSPWWIFSTWEEKHISQYRLRHHFNSPVFTCKNIVELILLSRESQLLYIRINHIRVWFKGEPSDIRHILSAITAVKWLVNNFKQFRVIMKYLNCMRR